MPEEAEKGYIIPEEQRGLKTRQGLTDETLVEIVERGGSLYHQLGELRSLQEHEGSIGERQRFSAEMKVGNFRTELGTAQIDFGWLPPFQKLKDAIEELGPKLAEKYGFEYKPM